jgi:hypothetical protein
MKFKISVRQNRTFLQRFNENALWWGIPPGVRGTYWCAAVGLANSAAYRCSRDARGGPGQGRNRAFLSFGSSKKK